MIPNRQAARQPRTHQQSQPDPGSRPPNHLSRNGAVGEDADMEFVFRQRSRPATAHAAIRMDDGDGDGDRGRNRTDSQMDWTSLGNSMDARRMTADAQRKKHLRSLHQITRDGDLDALKRAVMRLPTDRVVDHVNSSEDINEERTPLHYAARYWHYDIAAELIALGADVNKTDYYLSTALHYAAKYRRTGDRGAGHRKIPQPYRGADFREIIGSASSRTQTVTSDESIEESPQTLAGRGKTAVQAKGGTPSTTKDQKSNMRSDGGPSLIKLLIDSGADVNAPDYYGTTPLHVCCMRGSLKSAKELLDTSDVDPLAADRQGLQALHNACIYGYPEIVKLLIRHKAELRARDVRRQTPLHRAALAGYSNIVKILLNTAEQKHGLEYKAKMLRDEDANKNAVLHLGALKGNPEVCAELLRHGADPEARKGGSGFSALHIAAKSGNVALCMVLLDGGANIEATNKILQTPLHLAAHFDRTECVKLFLSKGAEKDPRDANSFTPLLLAVSSGSADTIQALLDGGAAVDAVDSEDRSALYWAARKGNLGAAELLFRHPVGLEIVNKRDKEGNTALHAAADKGHARVVRLLLDNGARIDAKNDDEDTPLTNAAYNGHTEVVELLLKTDASVVNDIEEHSYTSLHLACMNNHYEVAALLVAAGADVEAKDLDFITPLDYAAFVGNINCIKLLAKKGAAVNNADRYGITPLHRATFADKSEAVKELLRRGANVSATTSDGYNPLDSAIRGKARKSAEAIICSDQWRKAMDNWILDEDTGFRKTPLRALIENMPELAALVFDKCVKRTSEATDGSSEGSERHLVTFEYTYLDDLEWAYQSLRRPGGVKAHCTSCCCCACWFGFCNLGRSWHNSDCPAAANATRKVAFGGTKVGQEISNQDYQKFTGDEKIPVKPEDPEDVNDAWDDKNKGITENFNPVKNHPLSLMVKHRRMALLNHPLSRALVDYKWKKFGRLVYYSNMGFYFIFVIFLTGYALTVDPPEATITDTTKGEFVFGASCKGGGSGRQASTLGSRADDHIFTYIARPVIFVMAALNTLREIFQLVHRKLLTYLDAENALELACYATAVVFVLDFSECSIKTGAREPWQWQVGAIAVFLAWANLLLFIRKVPFFGIYVVMVTDVFRTFCKFFLVFMFFIIGFAMAFHILLHQQTAFRSPTEAFVKTFIMMVGELDFDSIFYDAPTKLIFYPTLTYILFVIFVLVMSIILMNLLVGLAVSDIKTVQENAILERLAMQVRLVIEVETMLPHFIRRRCICSGETMPDPNPDIVPKFIADAMSSSNSSGNDPESNSKDELIAKMNDKAPANVSEMIGTSGSGEESSGGNEGHIKAAEEIQRRLKTLESETTEKTSAIIVAQAETNEKTKELETQLTELLVRNKAMADLLDKVAEKLDVG